MLDMNKVIGNEVVRDNEITINGVTIGKLSDKEAERVISIIRAMVSGCETGAIRENPVSKPVHVVRDYSKIPAAQDTVVEIKWLDNNHFVLGTYCGKATTMAFHKLLNGMIAYDADYIREGEVYKRDYGSHKKGEQKKGAWKLEKASDTFNRETTSFIITADAIQGARSDIADRIAKRESRLG